MAALIVAYGRAIFAIRGTNRRVAFLVYVNRALLIGSNLDLYQGRKPGDSRRLFGLFRFIRVRQHAYISLSATLALAIVRIAARFLARAVSECSDVVSLCRECLFVARLGLPICQNFSVLFRVNVNRARVLISGGTVVNEG